MTFSILALDRRTGAIGGAAATGNLAVGAWVLRAAADGGAAATQGNSVSSLWGDQAIDRLRLGEPADDVVRKLTGPDQGRDHRQLAVLDRSGLGSAWTGGRNPDAKGHRAGDGYVIAGNWLTSNDVLSAMERAYLDVGSDHAIDFAQHLLSVIEAGVKAGSDARGLQSAALRIVALDEPPLDLRVDHHTAPLDQLRALLKMATSPPYTNWEGTLPTSKDPHRC